MGAMTACSSDADHVEDQMEAVQETVAPELLEELEAVSQVNEEVNELNQEIDDLLEEL